MIKGSIVALVSPMFEDGTIDYDSYRNLIEMHLAAEREHRALEAQARARGRLEKQRGEDLPVALVGILLGVLHDRAGGVDELHDLLRGQLHNVDQMLHITPDFLPGSSSRRRGFRGRPAAARRRPR